MDEQISVTVYASFARRLFALGALGILGGMLIYLGLTLQASISGKFLLLVLGAGALWSGEKLRRATMRTIELRDDGLYDSDGTVIAPMDAIVSIDRSTLAFKPSNGFILTLNTSLGRTWRPGLWWRIGRRVGVGGVTSAPQTKAMSEIIAVMMQNRGEE